MNKPDSSASHLLRAVVFALIWLLVILGIVSLYVEFRGAGVIELFGETYEGKNALAVFVVATTISVVLLAAALNNFHRYRLEGGGSKIEPEDKS